MEHAILQQPVEKCSVIKGGFNKVCSYEFEGDGVS